MKRQLAFLIARAQIPVEWLHPSSADDEETEEVEFETDLQDCLYNTKLSQHFRDFGKEVGVEDAKSLEDVYKSHLENTSRYLLKPYFGDLTEILYRTRHFCQRGFCTRKFGRNIRECVC